MKKRILAVIIAVIMIAALAIGVTASVDQPFEDVRAGSYYAEAVRWAVENGITKGTSATTFSPDKPCTRAQVVTFLYRYWKTYDQPAPVPVATPADAPVPTEPTEPTEPTAETEPVTLVSWETVFVASCSNEFSTGTNVKIIGMDNGMLRIECPDIGLRLHSGDNIRISADLLRSFVLVGRYSQVMDQTRLPIAEAALNVECEIVIIDGGTILIPGEIDCDAITVCLRGDGTNAAYVKIEREVQP